MKKKKRIFYVTYFYQKNNQNDSFGINGKLCDVSNVFTEQGFESLIYAIRETEKADKVVITNIIPFHDKKRNG